jgi:hypothetical protein
MLSDANRITFSHLRAHSGEHSPACVKSWLSKRGLDWNYFCRDGYTVAELRAACSPGGDTDLERLIEFIDGNGLWGK